MYTNPFNRKHSTIRQVLDRLLDPTRKPIRRSESVSSSSSNSSKSSSRSWNGSNHSQRGILQWGRKWTEMIERLRRKIVKCSLTRYWRFSFLEWIFLFLSLSLFLSFEEFYFRSLLSFNFISYRNSMRIFWKYWCESRMMCRSRSRFFLTGNNPWIRTKWNEPIVEEKEDHNFGF